MKKHILIVLSLLLLLGCAAVGDQPDAPMASADVTLTVGGVDNLKPYFYRDGSGGFKGYNVDVMDAVAADMGVRVVYREVQADSILDELEKGGVDLVLGVSHQSEYGDRLVSSDAFIQNSFNIFVMDHNHDIQELEDLKGKRIALCKTDPAYLMFKDTREARLFLCETQKSAYNLLKNGVVDAYVANMDLARNYIDDPQFQKTVNVVGGKVNMVPTGAVTLREKAGLIQQVDESINQLRNQGRLEEIRIKWFGQKMAERPEVLYRIIFGIVAVAVALLLVVLLILRFNKALKKEVSMQTAELAHGAEFKDEIVDSIFECLLTLDTGLVITSVNRQLRESGLAGCQDPIGKPMAQTGLGELIAPDDLDAVLSGSVRVINQETALEREDKTVFYEYSVTAINIGGAVAGLTVTFKDITEEKVMRQRIINTDKMESLGRLTAGIAHEIRNPLTSIDMYVKLLPERFDDQAFRDQMSEDLTKEIRRLDQLIRNLLDYTRPQPSQRERFQVGDEVAFILRLLQTTHIEKNGITVVNNIPGDLCICFDRQQFKQILLNIIINAVHALADVADPMIVIDCASGADGVRLDLYNNGRPISPEDKEKIFEPFFSTREGGSGLGLSIVSQLCKENGSEICLSENSGRGVKFTVRIPLPQADQCQVLEVAR